MIVSPLKMPSISLPPLVSRKIFGKRPGRNVALQPLDRAGSEDQHAVAALPAQHLLPGVGGDIDLVPGQVLRERRRGRVADGEARAVVGDPVAVRHTHARGRAVPGEDDVARHVDRREIGEPAIIGPRDGRVELQLLDHVGHPALAEAFPGEQGDRARPEQAPQGHLDRAGIGGGHDADAVAGGHAAAHAGSIRWHGRAAPCRASSGASGRAIRSPAFREPSPAASRRGRKRKKGARGAPPAWGSSLYNSPRREHAPRWDGVAHERD